MSAAGTVKLWHEQRSKYREFYQPMAQALFDLPIPGSRIRGQVIGSWRIQYEFYDFARNRATSTNVRRIDWSTARFTLTTGHRPIPKFVDNPQGRQNQPHRDYWIQINHT